MIVKGGSKTIGGKDGEGSKMIGGKDGEGGNAVYLLENNSHLTDLLNVKYFPSTLLFPLFCQVFSLYSIAMLSLWRR